MNSIYYNKCSYKCRIYLTRTRCQIKKERGKKSCSSQLCLLLINLRLWTAGFMDADFWWISSFYWKRKIHQWSKIRAGLTKVGVYWRDFSIKASEHFSSDEGKIPWSWNLPMPRMLEILNVRSPQTLKSVRYSNWLS